MSGRGKRGRQGLRGKQGKRGAAGFVDAARLAVFDGLPDVIDRLPIVDLGSQSSSQVLTASAFGSYVFFNPTAGSLTLNLPPSPQTGAFLTVRNHSGTNALSIRDAGSTVLFSLSTSSTASLVFYGGVWVRM